MDALRPSTSLEFSGTPAFIHTLLPQSFYSSTMRPTSPKLQRSKRAALSFRQVWIIIFRKRFHIPSLQPHLAGPNTLCKRSLLLRAIQEYWTSRFQELTPIITMVLAMSVYIRNHGSRMGRESESAWTWQLFDPEISSSTSIFQMA